MARTYKRTEEFEIATGEDVWPLLARAEAILSKAVQTWGPGDFEPSVQVEDSRGSGTYATVAEAQADTHSPLSSVMLWFWETDGGPDPRHAGAYVMNIDSPRTTNKWFRVVAAGPDEHTVVGLTTLTLADVKAARETKTLQEPVQAPPPAALPQPVTGSVPQPIQVPVAQPIHSKHEQGWWSNPWVVGIGVTVIGTLLAAGIIALLFG